MSLRDVKRAMEVMVWFYENFNNFSPLIQDEYGDGDGDDDDKDDNNGVESKNREERKDERPSYRQERPIIEEELFSREYELPAVQNEIPFIADWRPASLTEESRPPKKEPAFLEEKEEEVSFKEQPAVRKEQLAFREGRPTLQKTQSPLKEEHLTIKEERSTLESLPSVFMKERSTLKGKQPITRKARSPGRKERSTIKEMPPTREPLFESLLLGRFPLASRGEPIPPEEPDLLLPEELIVGAPSQVRHLFSTNNRLNK